MPVTRRRFVKRLSVAAAAVAFPTVCSSRVLGANDGILVGLVVTGGYGHGIETAWPDIPQAEMVGVAAANAQGLAGAVKRLGAPQGSVDYRKNPLTILER